MKHVDLLVFETDAERASRLEQALKGCTSVKVVCAPIKAFWRYPGLTAVYVPAPYAEKWGSRPVFGEAQLFQTSAEEQADGLPPFVISGLISHMGDKRPLLSLLRSHLTEMIDAIEQADDAPECWRVGVRSRNLGAEQADLKTADIADVVRAVFCPGEATPRP